MTSPRLRVLARLAAALCGLALLPLVLFVQMQVCEPGGTPGDVLILMLLGAPCGMLVYYSRTGRWRWSWALALPLVALAQAATIVGTMALLPSGEATRLASTVAVSWLVVAVAHVHGSARSN